MSEYLFGDGDIAARRLGALAEVFAESTRGFLCDSVDYNPVLALDLGCGPGYTTHLISDVLGCPRAVGLDNSENFLSLARRTETSRVSFLLHDVTLPPFPVGPADLLFCRFLLTHLRNPQLVVESWARQLQSKGLLLMEETDWMQTDNAVFGTYIRIVESMLASQSNKLNIGPDLDRLESSGLLRKKKSLVRRLPVPNHRAATMFYLNLQSWKNQPFIRENYSTPVIKKLEEDLRDLAQESGDRTEIEWGLRQLVMERL